MSTVDKTEIKENLGTMGAQYALIRRRRHPSVTKYIIDRKNGKEIFDLDRTSAKFVETLAFINKLGTEGSKILFVTSRKESEDLLKSCAKNIQMPYVVGRWIGGTLSNIERIRKRVDRMIGLSSEKDLESWDDRYTKKECILLNRELMKLKNRFGGLADMVGKPSALLVIDSKKEAIAVAEANRCNIPVISIGSSDTDLNLVSYPIIVNCNSRTTIEYALEKVVEAYKQK